MTMRTGGVLISGAAVFALASSLAVSAKQDPAPAAEVRPPLIIKVGVDLIQIDAAVTDREGRPVKGLRAEDFTVEIDGKKQPVSNAMFFDGGPAARVGGGVNAAVGAPAAPATPTPVRTLVFMVDDLGASFGSMYKAKRAMKKFAAGWDFREARVGLRSTSDDGETLVLSNSPEKFDRAISGLRYNVRSIKGASSEPGYLAPSPSFETGPGVPSVSVTSFSMGNPALSRSNYDQRVYSLLSTINALRSVPGRKAMVLVSEGLSFGRDRDQLGISSPFADLFAEGEGVDSVLHMITEVANRASVVIYTLDPSGLVHDGPGADVASAPSAEARQAVWSARVGNHWSLARLSEDTGGLSIYNHNDLPDGLRQIVNDQRAYYLIGFEPPRAAFEKSSGRPKLHKIKLRVNRPDVNVRTRAGFYGVTDEDVIQKAPLVAMPEH